MGGLGGWLGPALTATTNVVGAYQGAQADLKDRDQKQLALRIQQQRQAHNDEITNALKEAQRGALTAPVAKPKRSSATFKLNGQPTLGSMDESGTYYDVGGNELTTGVTPFDKTEGDRTPRTFMVNGKPVEGLTDKGGKFYNADGTPIVGNVSPYVAPKEPAIVQGNGPDGAPHVFRVPKAGGTATEVEGINPKPSGTNGGRGAATIQKAVAKNQEALSVIDDALAELDKHPDAVGVLEHGRGLPYVGDQLDQRADSTGVGARAQISNIGSLVLHDRSGAAITVSEFPRLAPFVPNIRDTPSTIRSKLVKLKNGYMVETAALKATPATASTHATNDPGGNVDLGAPSQAQQLWDAAVKKHGEAKVVAEYGPRPQ